MHQRTHVRAQAAIIPPPSRALFHTHLCLHAGKELGARVQLLPQHFSRAEVETRTQTKKTYPRRWGRRQRQNRDQPALDRWRSGGYFWCGKGLTDHVPLPGRSDGGGRLTSEGSKMCVVRSPYFSGCPCLTPANIRPPRWISSLRALKTPQGNNARASF